MTTEKVNILWNLRKEGKKKPKNQYIFKKFPLKGNYDKQCLLSFLYRSSAIYCNCKPVAANNMM